MVDSYMDSASLRRLLSEYRLNSSREEYQSTEHASESEDVESKISTLVREVKKVQKLRKELEEKKTELDDREKKLQGNKAMISLYNELKQTKENLSNCQMELEQLKKEKAASELRNKNLISTLKNKLHEPDLQLRFDPLEHIQHLIQDLIQNQTYITNTFECDYGTVTLKNSSFQAEFVNGFSVKQFANRDIKEEFPDGKSVYYFAKNKTVQTTFPDKKVATRFYNGQVEKEYPCGKKKVIYPNGDTQILFLDGSSQWLYLDGVTEIIDSHGNTEIHHPGGLKVYRKA